MTSSRPEVATSSGAVRGTTEGEVQVFRGIPFAQPPVGALRLAAPEPVRPWEGVRDALTFGPPAPQSQAFARAPEAPLDSSGDDRGWLTLNIWTPELGSARLPVLVWIYGGGYTDGRADDPLYDGARLARENSVVVVSLNYRLGAEGFGFFAGAPANRGLLDQIAALAWVQDNIERLLVHSDLAAQAVGQRIGFTEGTAFARFFRQRTGLAPASFRSQARGTR